MKGVRCALGGEGVLAPGCPAALNLTDALPNSLAFLIFGVQRIDVPFKGGTLVPSLDVFTILQTNGNGEIRIPFNWAYQVPADTRFYTQFWLPDVLGPEGMSASNALEMIAQ